LTSSSPHFPCVIFSSMRISSYLFRLGCPYPRPLH
jgi:hypothetical protein